MSATVKDEAGNGLSYTLVWKAPDAQLSYTDNQKEYAYVCIPDDVASYNRVEGTVKEGWDVIRTETENNK